MKPQDLLDRLAAGYEYDPMYGALCNERDQLKAENAKLRELCADMWEAIKTHKRINFAQLLRFGERVHELGVGVDE